MTDARTSAVSGPPEWSRIDVAALIIIAAAALMLRLFQLGAESLWIDEWSTVQLARSPLTDILRDRAASVNPPLYFVLMRAWVLAFGDSEWAIRLPAALCSTAAVIGCYAVGRQLGGIQGAIASSTLTATSVFHLSYAQEARGYALMTLLAVASLWSLLAILEGSAGRRGRTVYVIATSALLYTHFYGLFVVLAEWLTYLWARLLGLRHPSTAAWLRIQAAVALAFLPWSVFLIAEYRLIQDGYWIPRPTWGSLQDTLMTYANNRPTVLAALTVLALFGAVRIARRVPSMQRGLAFTPIVGLVSLLATPVLIPFIVSQFSTPVYYTRYTLAGSLGLFFLAGIGVSWLSRYAAIALLVSLLVASAGPVAAYYRTQTKEPWRDVSLMLDRQVTSADIILFNDGSYASLFKDYYSSRADLTTKEFNVGLVLRTEQSSTSGFSRVDELDEVTANYNRVWLVLYKPNDTNGEIRTRLSHLRQLHAHRFYGGIEIYAFGRKR